MFVLWLCFVHAPDLFVAQQPNRGASGWQGCEREAGLRWTVMFCWPVFVQTDVAVLQCVIMAARTRLHRGNNSVCPLWGVFGYLSADTATDVWRVGSDCVTERGHGAVSVEDCKAEYRRSQARVFLEPFGRCLSREWG